MTEIVFMVILFQLLVLEVHIYRALHYIPLDVLTLLADPRSCSPCTGVEFVQQ